MCRSKAEGGRRCLNHVFKPTTSRRPRARPSSSRTRKTPDANGRAVRRESGYTELRRRRPVSRVVRNEREQPGGDLYADQAEPPVSVWTGEVLRPEAGPTAVGAPVAKVRRDGPMRSGWSTWTAAPRGYAELMAFTGRRPSWAARTLTELTKIGSRVCGSTDRALMAFATAVPGSIPSSPRVAVYPFTVARGAAGSPAPCREPRGADAALRHHADDQYRTIRANSSGRARRRSRARVEGLRPKSTSFGAAARGSMRSLSVL